MLSRIAIPEVLLRLGTAFAFLYPAVSAIQDPDSWLGYYPAFILTLIGNDLLALHAFGVIEVVVAIWILFGRNILIPSVVATIMLLAIILFNLTQFPILFRDVSIVCMTAALAYLSYRRHA